MCGLLTAERMNGASIVRGEHHGLIVFLCLCVCVCITMCVSVDVSLSLNPFVCMSSSVCGLIV